VQSLLISAFKRGVKRDHLRVTFASGAVQHFGDPNAQLVAVRFNDVRAELRLLLDPALALGELYAEGALVLEAGSLYDLIALFKRGGRAAASLFAQGAYALRYAQSYGRAASSRERAARDVAHHYNLDERFYRLFLDSDLQYSCAYFESSEQSLEAAQLAKKRHLAAKLLVAPGDSVLDIGSGWGGLALYLAQVCGARATGITLSEPQRIVAERRASERGLSDRARFLLQDYRELGGLFERIVSVGMFEHVGPRSYGAFFRKCAQLLAPRGVFVLHSIGRTRPQLAPNPFIEKYIFPGSYIPALSEVLPAVERAGFLITDIEILPLHYAQTLRAWRERFVARRAEVLALYDERLFRLWEFYLTAAEIGFRMDRMFVFQLQLTRPQNVVPSQRTYLQERERVLSALEQEVGIAGVAALRESRE
jgi:cyclopropane-fatty-acyl-phospholipid synthase